MLFIYKKKWGCVERMRWEGGALHPLRTPPPLGTGRIGRTGTGAVQSVPRLDRDGHHRSYRVVYRVSFMSSAQRRSGAQTLTRVRLWDFASEEAPSHPPTPPPSLVLFLFFVFFFVFPYVSQLLFTSSSSRYHRWKKKKRKKKMMWCGPADFAAPSSGFGHREMIATSSSIEKHRIESPVNHNPPTDIFLFLFLFLFLFFFFRFFILLLLPHSSTPVLACCQSRPVRNALRARIWWKSEINLWFF